MLYSVLILLCVRFGRMVLSLRALRGIVCCVVMFFIIIVHVVVGV